MMPSWKNWPDLAYRIPRKKDHFVAGAKAPGYLGPLEEKNLPKSRNFR